MNPSDFTEPTTGRLVPTIERQQAFVPAPLPPAFDLASVAISLMEAMQALGELKGACRRLQNPYMLVRPLQRNEALTSSAMEGTYTTDGHLLLAEAGLEAQSDESTREVINYLNALNESLDLLRTLPISHRVIKRAHEILLSGLSLHRGTQKRPGEYKRDQNWIGGRTIENARFVPPPPAETQVCMDELERYINREDASFPPPLIDLALVHYQIESIHPFADGNGRVGRMIISLMAVHSGLLDMPILYISPAMERYKDEYIDHMFNVSAKGDWEGWISFFCKRVVESCKETIRTIDRLISLQTEYRDRSSSAGRSANLAIVIDFLFERPAITVTEASQKLGVTYAAARKTIDKLVEIGIIEEIPTSYPKIFYSPTIMRASRPD
ncbi:Fic family protein [Aurantimonas marina]|uniref:Fic family protein n=1 Tax=Aurantimonas marina TaxID=2780508 RepID=UPI0019D30438|nr:Fic family protein [Aurantimonas marina]